jgi:hypothetical protein
LIQATPCRRALLSKNRLPLIPKRRLHSRTSSSSWKRVAQSPVPHLDQRGVHDMGFLHDRETSPSRSRNVPNHPSVGSPRIRLMTFPPLCCPCTRWLRRSPHFASRRLLTNLSPKRGHPQLLKISRTDLCPAQALPAARTLRLGRGGRAGNPVPHRSPLRAADRVAPQSQFPRRLPAWPDCRQV